MEAFLIAVGFFPFATIYTCEERFILNNEIYSKEKSMNKT
jgi:hypothetical protein